MITLRTKTLLCLVAVCGLGIGMLAPFSDGLYSAVLLCFFPFLAAFMALSIGSDLSKVPPAPPAKTRAEVCEKQAPTPFVVQMPMITSHAVN
jgi:hypothetical protein